MSKLPMLAGDPHTYPRHSGIDFLRGPSKLGDAFFASGPGRVVRLSKNAAGGYWIVIKYDAIPREVGYAHMRSHAGCPRPGTRVGLGTRLGYVGDRGTRVTGPHVHQEILGEATDSAIWKYFDRARTIAQALAGKGGASASTGGSDNIRGIQKALNALGHRLVVDGIKGPKTIAAIKAFQRSQGLVADGIWGPKTNAANNRLAVKRRPIVKHGSKNNYVKIVQRKLGLTQDGIFGPKTKAAVVAFQRKHKLAADGIVGSKTWAKLGY